MAWAFTKLKRDESSHTLNQWCHIESRRLRLRNATRRRFHLETRTNTQQPAAVSPPQRRAAVAQPGAFRCFLLPGVSASNCPPALAAEMWILKLSGFPFPHLFLSSLVIVSALNQPTQSDRLDFVLCILFSHFSSLRAAPPTSAFPLAALQKPGLFFLKFRFLPLVWPFRTRCRCNQSGICCCRYGTYAANVHHRTYKPRNWKSESVRLIAH